MKASRMIALAASLLLAALSTVSALAYTVPQTNDLLFAVNTDTLPASGNTGNWTNESPVGSYFFPRGTPTAVTMDGAKWEKNVAFLTGYLNNWSWTRPLYINGVTAIAVVKPLSGKINDRDWTPVIDILFRKFVLGVRNDDRRVIIERSNGTVDSLEYSTYTIPDAKKTVLSVTVQNDGSYQLWADNTLIKTGAAISGGFTSLDNGARLVCLGHSDWDPSATYNGYMGDILMWKVALDDSTRSNTVSDLMAKFKITAVRTTTSPATSITPDSATMNGTLVSEGSGPGGDTEVTLCYGTTPGGDTPVSWANQVPIGSAVPVGALSANITSLTPGSMYYYSFYASNSTGYTWSDMPASFSTPGTPTITNEAPTNVRVATARACGNLTVTNFAPTTVKLFYGAADGGTDPLAWDTSVDLGIKPQGSIYYVITGLTSVVHYRYYATNLAGEAWCNYDTTITPIAPFDPTGYTRLLTIGFSSYAGTETLGNFPALIKLNTDISLFFYADFKSGNNDIRFTDMDGTELPYEIDTWNPSGSSFLWVQVPYLTSAAQIKMYYGKADVSAPTYTTDGSTWADGYRAVWHMNSTSPADATARNNPGFARGTMASATGPIGPGNDFASGYIYVSNSTDVALSGDWTYSTWLWAVNAGTERGIMGRWDSSFIWQVSGDNRFSAAMNGQNWRWVSNAGNTVNVGAWHYGVFTVSGKTGRFYLDGQDVGSWDLGNGTLWVGTKPLYIGSGGENWDNRWLGKLDEVRMIGVARSLDWIKAEYSSQNSPTSFASYVVSSLVAGDAFVDITNVAGTVTLPGSTTVFPIAGTNNEYTVGDITWTNALTGLCGIVLTNSATDWGINVDVTAGNNVITVEGKNASDLPSFDVVTLVIPSVIVSSAPATEIALFSAMLNGSVNPNDVDTFTWFEYGTSPSYGNNTESTPAGNGNMQIACSNAVSLSPGTVYHFRAAASNLFGAVVYGADLTLQTLAPIDTLPATDIASGSAVLQGTANPVGVASIAWFEWGTSTNYGNTTSPTIDIGSGSAYMPFSQLINGLSDNVVYHFRAVANNGITTIYGNDLVFIGGKNITQRGIWFSVLAASLPDSNGAATGPWTNALPANGKVLTTMGTPTVEIADSVKWEDNYTIDGDGFLQGTYPNQIDCNGVTIVATVKPRYVVRGGEVRGEVVSILYSDIYLAVNHGNGEVMICHRPYHNENTGIYLPDRARSVLGLVVQPNGFFTLYVNGTNVWTSSTGEDYTYLKSSWAQNVAVGHNSYDGWSPFNGNIGDVYVYTNALSETELAAVEGYVYVPLPNLEIVNVTNSLVVPSTTTSFTLYGTNNALVVGDIYWNNSLGGSGSQAAGTPDWYINVPLTIGRNVITVSGTTDIGSVVQDAVTIIRATVTNVILSAKPWPLCGNNEQRQGNYSGGTALTTAIPVWSNLYQYNVGIFGSGVADADNLYMAVDGASQGYNLIALDLATGSLVWGIPLGNWANGTPALSETMLFVSDADGTVYGIDKSDGSIMWRANVPSAANGAILLNNGRIFLEADNNNGGLFCFNALDGAPIWSSLYAAGDGSWAGNGPSLSPDGTQIYTHDNNGHIRAFSTVDGSVVWTSTFATGLGSLEPIVDDSGNVYCGVQGLAAGSENDYIVKLSAVDGSTTWSCDLGYTFALYRGGYALSADGATIYVSRQSDQADAGTGVTAIATSTGTIKWDAVCGDNKGGCVVGAGNIIMGVFKGPNNTAVAKGIRDDGTSATVLWEVPIYVNVAWSGDTSVSWPTLLPNGDVIVEAFVGVIMRITGGSSPADVTNLSVSRGASYGQMSLAWNSGTIQVLACTNRYYSNNPADWFVLADGVSSPWSDTDAPSRPSTYYRIVSGVYTSLYDVGKFDVDIAAGSISWLSFPFAPQAACNVLSEWFGQQLEARDYTSYTYPLLQVQNGLGGSIITRSYYVDTFGEYTTNWWPSDDPIVQNAGYVLFLAPDQPAVKLTSLGMVPTNDVTLAVPYQTIPWVGLSYPSSVDMRDSGIANLFNPPQKYSLFNYDFVDSQETLGGSVWYAEYFIDDWGGGTTNFFIDVAGADRINGGKGYLLFFSTTRNLTGTWNYVKPY